MHWFDLTQENVGYTTVKLAMLAAPLAIKVAWIYQWGSLSAEVIAMHGGRMRAALYLAGQESFAFHRFVTKPGRVFSLPALAVVSAWGWASTAEQHGAVPPGTGMGMPMTAPPSTATSSNPAGWDFGTWWDNLF